jgi:hypothetical protein
VFVNVDVRLVYDANIYCRYSFHQPGSRRQHRATALKSAAKVAGENPLEFIDPSRGPVAPCNGEAFSQDARRRRKPVVSSTGSFVYKWDPVWFRNAETHATVADLE